jgi:hypothetical protein
MAPPLRGAYGLEEAVRMVAGGRVLVAIPTAPVVSIVAVMHESDDEFETW